MKNNCLLFASIVIQICYCFAWFGCDKKEESKNISPEEKLISYKQTLQTRLDRCIKNLDPNERINSRWYQGLVRQKEYLNNLSVLDHPYLIGVFLYPSGEFYTYKNHLFLQIVWIEDGFDTQGIQIISMNNNKMELKLPIFNNYWNEKIKKYWGYQIERRFIMDVILEDKFYLKSNPNDDLPYVMVPKDIALKKVMISLYDKNDKKSNSVELFISEDAQEFFIDTAGDTKGQKQNN